MPLYKLAFVNGSKINISLSTKPKCVFQQLLFDLIDFDSVSISVIFLPEYYFNVSKNKLKYNGGVFPRKSP